MRFYGLILLVFASVSLSGCSNPYAEMADARELASTLYRDAEEAFQRRDFSVADEKYKTAVETGALYLDLRVSATIKRAVCVGVAGDLESAQGMLTELEEKAGVESDLFYSARSFLYGKQGKKREANMAWRKARRLNRNVIKFSS